MFKYMKYEIKGTYKFILGVLALVLILFTGIYIYANKGNGSSIPGIIFIGLSIMILFSTALVVFLYIVGSFRKELYEDRGYLTFTLPLTGNKIVGSKLIVALLWFFILGLVIALYNLIMVMVFSQINVNISKLFSEISKTISLSDFLVVMVTIVFSGINILILIYFSMALSKITFRNKKIGGLWFIIFLILSGVLTFGDYEISKLLPFYLDLHTFNVQTIDILKSMDTDLFTTNLASCLYDIVTIVALFLGTGYLIEKKINL